jgi:hypothetical protein
VNGVIESRGDGKAVEERCGKDIMDKGNGNKLLLFSSLMDNSTVSAYIKQHSVRLVMNKITLYNL